MHSMNSGCWRHCCFTDSPIVIDGKLSTISTDSIVKVWNSDQMKQLRMDLINGVKNEHCKTCWKNEEKGVYSFRQKSNAEIPVTGHTIDTVKENNGFHKDLPKTLAIKVGNLCNLKCIMCSPPASSKHQEEVIKWKASGVKLPSYLQYIEDFDNGNPEFKNFEGISKSDNLDQIISNIEEALPTCLNLELVGGEPLINPITDKLLSLLVKKGYAETIGIQFITNLSSLKSKQISMLSKIARPELTVSFDHIEKDKFEFIRFPSNYITFEKNFYKLLEITKIKTRISTTFSIFNIFDLPKIFDRFETFDIPLVLNLVSQPSYFSIKYLDQDQKDTVIEMIDSYITTEKPIFKKNPSVFNFLKTLKEYCGDTPADFDEVVKERTRVLELYDVTRKTNYKSLFPFIREYK